MEQPIQIAGDMIRLAGYEGTQLYATVVKPSPSR